MFQWIRLTLYDMDIEYDSTCSYDRLSVFTGNTLYDQIAEGLCGSDVPEDSRLTIPHNHAIINFNTDGSVTGKGFTGSYEIIDGK